MAEPNPLDHLHELIVALIAVLQMISSASITAPPADEPPPVATGCVVSVTADPMVRAWAESAIAELEHALDEIELRLADRDGVITVGFGGEWPVDQPQLGWTAPDRRTILLNPDHPLAARDAAMIDVIAHEFGHVLIGPDHVDDGTLLDPHLDGTVRLGPTDLAALDALDCANFEWGQV